jgi:hypothetical protein
MTNSYLSFSMRYSISLLLVALAFVSCFHKDVMNDRADDVATTFIYSGTDGKCIITKEQVFQAQSKESGGGVTHISGYADYRLTSYDPSTGNVTGRVDLGEGIENAFVVVGTTPGKIWIYSIDPELGLHCRNPKTLEVISDEKTLTATAPLKGFAFARPAWNLLNQSYGWNAENGKLMLSDMQGYHYYFDPAKNTLEKTEDAIVDYTWAVSKTGSTAYFTKDDYVSLGGNGRQKLMYRYEDSTAKLSYLNGELLLDVDPLHDVERKKDAIFVIENEWTGINNWVNRLQLLFPGIEEKKYSQYSHEEWEVKDTISELQRKMDDLQRDKESIERKGTKYLDNAALSDAPGTIFILHATDISDTARMQLTKVQLDGKKLTEAWTIKLADFYRDPEKANSKGAFETVFSDGNPAFGYEWYEISDGKLFMISQLQLICLDAKSGKTLWVHPL